MEKDQKVGFFDKPLGLAIGFSGFCLLALLGFILHTDNDPKFWYTTLIGAIFFGVFAIFSWVGYFKGKNAKQIDNYMDKVLWKPLRRVRLKRDENVNGLQAVTPAPGDDILSLCL